MEFDPYPAFSKVLAGPAPYRSPDAEEIARLQMTLGEAFVSVVSRDGLAFYRQQRIRTVAPEDFSDVAKLWPLDGAVGEIFMITCFGDFFCWRGGYCWFVSVNDHFAIELVDSMEWFLGNLLVGKGYLGSIVEGFSKAGPVLKRHSLKPSQMLAWTPALALGGSRAESALEIVEIHEAHLMLAQLRELRLQRY